MFETIFSSADKLVEAGEEIQETRYRSRLDPHYLRRFMGAGGLIIVGFAAIILGNMTADLQIPVPSEYMWVLFIPPALVILWIEIEHHSLMYHFTDKRLIAERGVFSKSFSSVPYKDITRVRISQTPTQRVLGIGILKVEVKGMDTDEITIEGIRHPQQFRLKLTAQKKAHTDGGVEQEDMQSLPQTGEQSPAGDLFSKERLEAEIGRIERRRQQLQQQYRDGQLDDQEYERRWYILQGEEQAVERQLNELESQQQQTDTSDA